MSVGIADVIIEALIEDFEAACLTDVPTADETYVDNIVNGKLTVDPESTHGNHIEIYDCDPRQSTPMSWRDEVARVSSDYPLPGRVLLGIAGDDFAEVGGGQHWWRRFTIHVLCSYAHLGYNQDLARQYAHTIFQRVKKALRDNTITGSDDYGESVADAFPKARWEERYATGEGTEWVWHCFLGIQVLTEVA